ncbi:EcsC family protein [Bacillus velezensis]|uniref:EcsC family protein n=1 Tax=Bacillus amyloliquefaciens group TaxID=1938374 RepID=UPI001459ACFA|nr:MULTISPECIES: EcsC family protein [Bacillus amyloliquefaciens group]MCR4367941.1 EcsC family protein [Bacillus amyloliquefaciens]MCV3201055.1 EcsC family protein [Bacillus velezensis]MDP1501964.1 EcsC family protein [Bacillus velezensis]MDP1505823.1 EcsC family protein [Bacillus velezensis]MDW0354810.1 EcsC family protein [Bacillus velezensis]
MTDDQQLIQEALQWKARFLRKDSMLERFSKGMQAKINERIPDKIHAVITESIKKMTEATMAGSNLVKSKRDTNGMTLAEKDALARQTVTSYQKVAAAEGIGTGAGGIFLGMADFPLLLSIKMKCLFDLASIYGYDVKDRDERLFLLFIFQLAFSSGEQRKRIYSMIEQWDSKKHDVDWRVFQQEYRDYLDVVKLFQLLPVVGAAVGGAANYKLLSQLGETARHVFHLRITAAGT